MSQQTLALATLAERMGVRIRYGTAAPRIVRQGGRVSGVQIVAGGTLPCQVCVFNGDPAALAAGHMGGGPRDAVAAKATGPRSLSAWIGAFAAKPSGLPLIHHNVFFSEDPATEFGPIGKGRMPEAPTL